MSPPPTDGEASVSDTLAVAGSDSASTSEKPRGAWVEASVQPTASNRAVAHCLIGRIEI